MVNTSLLQTAALSDAGDWGLWLGFSLQSLGPGFRVWGLRVQEVQGLGFKGLGFRV